MKPFLSDLASYLGKSFFKTCVYEDPDLDKKVSLFYATFNKCLPLHSEVKSLYAKKRQAMDDSFSQRLDNTEMERF